MPRSVVCQWTGDMSVAHSILEPMASTGLDYAKGEMIGKIIIDTTKPENPALRYQDYPT